MNLLMIPRLALKALRQNILRTALTMLGIIIGVGAVICVVAIGEGAQASGERAITNIGANMMCGVNRAGVRTGAFGTTTSRWVPRKLPQIQEWNSHAPDLGPRGDRIRLLSS